MFSFYIKAIAWVGTINRVQRCTARISNCKSMNKEKKEWLLYYAEKVKQNIDRETVEEND